MLRPLRAEYHTGKSSQVAGNLPDGLVPYDTFMHGVPANTAKRLLEVAGVQVVRGHWVASGHHFDKALDQAGQHQAYEALRTHTRFKSCDACPHET